MKFKKTVSALAALALSATAFAGLAVTVNAADPIYSNDFSSETLDNAVTWTATTKKASGYDHAQIGRGGVMSLEDGSLKWTTTGTNTGTYAHASYGIFNETIQTATTSSNYKISFDWRPTCENTAQDVALELINTDKNVILGLDLEHTRTNATVGSNTLKYYTGGPSGFKVADNSATSSRINGEGYLGSADKTTFATVPTATFDSTYNVELTVTSGGVGNLTITGSDETKLVNNATVTFDAGVALSDIYMTAKQWNTTPQGAIYLDNFVIEPVEVTTPTASYTVNYVCGTETVKTTTGGGYVGAAPVVDMDAFVADNGNKYYCVSNDVEGKTIEEGDKTVVTVTCREANKYNVSVKAVAGETELANLYAADNVIEDEKLTVPYPRYIRTDAGQLYLKDATGQEYNYKFTVGDDTYNSKLEYALQEGVTAAYYAEGEDVLTENSVSNANIRCSMGKGGDVTDKTTVTTLQPGKYTLEAGVWGGGKNEGNNSTYTFSVEETKILDVSTIGSYVKSVSEEFTVESATDITVEKTVTGTSGACVDYILICKTGDITVTPVEPEIPEVTVSSETTDFTDNAEENPARLYTGSYTLNANSAKVSQIVWTVNPADDQKPVHTTEPVQLPTLSSESDGENENGLNIVVGLIITIDDFSKVGSVTAELQ